MQKYLLTSYVLHVEFDLYKKLIDGGCYYFIAIMHLFWSKYACSADLRSLKFLRFVGIGDSEGVGNLGRYRCLLHSRSLGRAC